MIAIAAFGLWQGAARAQDAVSGDLQTLLNRLERVERDIRTMNIQISRGEVAAPVAATPTPPKPAPMMTEEEANGPAAARFAVRLGALEEQLQYSTGEMERLGHEIRQINDRLDKLIADLDYRLNAMAGGQAVNPATGGQPTMMQGTPAPEEDRTAKATPEGTAGQMTSDGTYHPALTGPEKTLGSGPTDTAVSKTSSYDTGAKSLGTVTEDQLKNVKNNNAVTGAPVAQTQLAAPTNPAAAQPAATVNYAVGTPKDQYKTAFRLLRKAEYEQAEAAWKSFLEHNPSDPLADNARYWLGETYYVRGQYVEAAETFLGGYQTNPQSPKAPDVLLKLGMSLASLDKKEEACASFQKLQKDYPKASDQIKAKLAREIKNNGC